MIWARRWLHLKIFRESFAYGLNGGIFAEQFAIFFGIGNFGLGCVFYGAKFAHKIKIAAVPGYNKAVAAFKAVKAAFSAR